MLTARGDEEDRVLGLRLGADDYVTKPFSPRELVLRVESVLRRASRPDAAEDPNVADAVLSDGDLRVDLNRHEVWRDGEPLALTGREFDLLVFLMRNPGVAYSREDLLRAVWGWDFGDQSTVTVHVRRLRTKVEPDPAAPVRLVTVWGVGYRWEPRP
jgi:DNA-binding response OmpR family regulator